MEISPKMAVALILGAIGGLLSLLAMQEVYGGEWGTVAGGVATVFIAVVLLAFVVAVLKD